MRRKIFPKNQFLRNVLTLMTGTSIAQAIPIAISPILTRIYSPEDFGLFALYMGVASVLSVVATGRYELAIMLPGNEGEALQITYLSAITSLFSSLSILIIISVFGRDISLLLGNQKIYEWLFFVPFTILLTGVYQSINYWYNRNKDFKKLSANRIIQSGSTGVGQLFLGKSGFQYFGLLFGYVLGSFVTTVLLLRNFIKEGNLKSKLLNPDDLLAQAKRYVDFPKFDVPTSFLNSASYYSPNILFNSFFSPVFAGFFFLTQRVLQAPITLISGSILDVFKEEAAKEYRRYGHSKVSYMKTLKLLITFSLVPFLVLYFTIEEIFAIFFGYDWVVAGEYAKTLMPALALRFISSPLSFMLYIAEKQLFNLVGMLFYFLGTISSFYFSTSHLEAVKLLNLTMSVYYFGYLLLSSKLSKVW